jgi:hypothetical protein
VKRTVDVDGEAVEFHMVLTPDPMRTEAPAAFKEGSGVPVYRALGGTASGGSLMLEQPPTKAHLDEYSDEELAALWRHKKRQADSR